MSDVTVAIPTREGARWLPGVLRALARQTVAHELLVCDSGSRDGSAELAREHGARVLEIPPAEFNHGRTRNLLLENAAGASVALLTQDAEPADERWLEELLGGLELAPDVGIAFGPYRPRPSAPQPVRIELDAWFASLSDDGRPVVERLSEEERGTVSVGALLGRRGFFSDANACLRRSAWERVPFRGVAIAEDRVLAVDMLRAGYAKAFVPAAVVLHSHDYTAGEEFRRCFDEWRGLREIYGWRESASPREALRALRGQLSQARRELSAEGAPPVRHVLALAAVASHQLVRRTGAVLGSHADRIPEELRARLSLEGRGGFQALDLDGEERR